MRKILLLLLVFSLTLNAEEIVVITNVQSDIKTLDRKTLRAIYLKKRVYWKSMKLTALNLPPNNTTREAFEKAVIHLSSEKLDSYWMKEHYRGKRPPYRVNSVQSAVEFVKKLKGAIAYIPAVKADKDVKILYRIKR